MGSPTRSHRTKLLKAFLDSIPSVAEEEQEEIEELVDPPDHWDDELEVVSI